MNLHLPKTHMEAVRFVWLHMMPYVGAAAVVITVLVKAGWIDVPARSAEVNTLREKIDRNQIAIQRDIDEAKKVIKNLDSTLKAVNRKADETGTAIQSIERTQQLMLQRLLGGDNR